MGSEKINYKPWDLQNWRGSTEQSQVMQGEIQLRCLLLEYELVRFTGMESGYADPSEESDMRQLFIFIIK